MKKIIQNILFRTLALITIHFVINDAQAQTFATTTQKAGAKVITQTVKTQSIERRDDYMNLQDATILITPSNFLLRIDGPQKVEVGSTQFYTAIPRMEKGFWWHVSSQAQIIEFYDDIVNVRFNTPSINVVLSIFDINDKLVSQITISASSTSNPLSAGVINTGSQTIQYDEVPANLRTSLSTGSTCTNNYVYQWQQSLDDIYFYDIEEQNSIDLLFNELLATTTFFRRKTICGVDTGYTGSAAVFVIEFLNGGIISNPYQEFNSGNNSLMLQTSLALNGKTNIFNYQWQVSTDGLFFTNLSNQNSQNLSLNNYSITTNNYFRRKVINGTDTAFSNIALVSIKQPPFQNPIIVTKFDSIFTNSNFSLNNFLKIPNDSIANEREISNPQIDSTEKSYLQLSIANELSENQYEDVNVTNLNSFFTQYFLSNTDSADNINARILGQTVTGITIKPIEAFVSDVSELWVNSFTNNKPLLDEEIRNKFSPNEYNDLLFNFEKQLYASTPVNQRNYKPTIPVNQLKNGAIIQGNAHPATNGNIERYYGSFYFPLQTNKQILWAVEGGTVVAQQTNMANGQIFVDVIWYERAAIQKVGLFEFNTKLIGTLPIVPINKPVGLCTNTLILPANQLLYYGQQVQQLSFHKCLKIPPTHSVSFQWYSEDWYAGTGKINIPGATAATYQPPPLIRPVMIYWCYVVITETATGRVVYSKYTNAATLSMQHVNAGEITTTSNLLIHNSPITINTVDADGGMIQSGIYRTTWLSSINNGPWQEIVNYNSNTFPSFNITSQNTKIKKKVIITGIPNETYNLPSKYWTAESEILEFNYNTQSQDWENRNYVRSNTINTRGIKLSWLEADGLPDGKKSQATTYYDGLGRKLQDVIKGAHITSDVANATKYDFVQHYAYELGGRVDKSYMAYPSTSTIGKFKTNAAVEQQSFYQTKFNDAFAFSKVEYDNTPYNNIKKAYAAGQAWQSNNISTEADIEPVNFTAEQVAKFEAPLTAGAAPVHLGNYQLSYLFKSYGKDEKGKKVVSYTNKMGQTILTKVQLADDNALSQSYTGWLSTYYVYDVFGQLRFTIPSKAVTALLQNGWIFNATIINELCFWYDYDELGRVIAKKTPGKDAEYLVYDSKSRPVFTQDNGVKVSEPNNPIMAVLYDQWDRPVITGLVYGKTMNQWAAFTEQTANDFISINHPQGGNFKLLNSPLTAAEINNPAVFKALSFNYYDHYNFNGAQAFDQSHTQNLSYINSNPLGGNIDPTNKTKRTIGSSTGSKTRVMDNTTIKYLTATVYYDEEGKPIQAIADNLRGSVDKSSTQYHFDGRVMSTSTTHDGQIANFNNFTILTKYIYDKIGRLKSTAKKIQNNTRNYQVQNTWDDIKEDIADYKIIATIKLNELGQMHEKILAPQYNNGVGLETQKFSYNIKGWLTGINKDYALGITSQFSNYFGLYLGYDNADGLLNNSQYNGQLTGLVSRGQGDAVQRRFDYQYDNAGRLLAANYLQRKNNNEAWNNTTANFSSKDISYDENGNLQSLTQMGMVVGNTTPVMLDKLVYDYTSLSNKLKKVTDQGNAGAANGKQGDFKDGNNTDDDYQYDANGRMIIDKNKRILQVTYNHLDKPTEIKIAKPDLSGEVGNIKYLYTADGGKMQKIVTEHATPANGNINKITTTTYAGAYTYVQVKHNGNIISEELVSIAMEEGRMRVITPTTTANYTLGGGLAIPGGLQLVFDYMITDHLANVRAVITEEENKAMSQCTMEDAALPSEAAVFTNSGQAAELAAYKVQAPSSWAANTSKVARLIAAAGGAGQVGPNVLLRVMAGDGIKAKTDYHYANATTNNPNNSNFINNLLTSFGTALNNGRADVITHGGSTQITDNLSTNADLSSMWATDPINNSNPTAPKAYLNYIFFDNQFNFVKEISGFKRVDANTGLLAMMETKVTQNGYVYVYLSNQSGEPVYFDNFEVHHQRGQLLEESNYYAYGLKMAGISSKAYDAPKNLYLYQGDYAEFDEESGYNEFYLRNYDPQIGRFVQADPFEEFPSPYTGMGNDPVNNVDPSGGSILSGITGVSNIFFNTAVAAIGGAMVGGIVGMFNGDENAWKKGAAIGAGLGLLDGVGSGIYNQLSNLGTTLPAVGGNVLSVLASPTTAAPSPTAPPGTPPNSLIRVYVKHGKTKADGGDNSWDVWDGHTLLQVDNMVYHFVPTELRGTKNLEPDGFDAKADLKESWHSNGAVIAWNMAQAQPWFADKQSDNFGFSVYETSITPTQKTTLLSNINKSIASPPPYKTLGTRCQSWCSGMLRSSNILPNSMRQYSWSTVPFSKALFNMPKFNLIFKTLSSKAP